MYNKYKAQVTNERKKKKPQRQIQTKINIESFPKDNLDQHT